MKLENVQKVLKDLIKNLDLVLIFLCWLISTFQGQMEYDWAVRLHFLLMAIAITLVATPRRKENWFVFAFWELSIYNVFDELMGGGDSYVWYELPIMVFILIHSWYKFKNSDGN